MDEQARLLQEWDEAFGPYEPEFEYDLDPSFCDE